MNLSYSLIFLFFWTEAISLFITILYLSLTILLVKLTSTDKLKKYNILLHLDTQLALLLLVHI